MGRGQGISINVIIITAIALIVLIVLIVILTGRVGIFQRGLGTCSGYCTSSAGGCGDDTPIPTKSCNDGDNPPITGDGFCCLPS